MLFKRDPLDKYAASFRPLKGAPEPKSLETNTGCKWPVGEKPFVFCGCATETGRYCSAHERMSGQWLRPLA